MIVLIIVLTLHHPVSCWTLRPYVWIYGEEFTIRWALKHGFTWKEIEEARARCHLDTK